MADEDVEQERLELRVSLPRGLICTIDAHEGLKGGAAVVMWPLAA